MSVLQAPIRIYKYHLSYILRNSLTQKSLVDKYSTQRRCKNSLSYQLVVFCNQENNHIMKAELQVLNLNIFGISLNINLNELQYTEKRLQNALLYKKFGKLFWLFVTRWLSWFESIIEKLFLYYRFFFHKPRTTTVCVMKSV